MKIKIRNVVFIIFCCQVIAGTSSIAQQKKYYVAAKGDDNNDGSSVQTAWHSISKINSINFKPGDSIFFEGGVVFKGNLKLTSGDNGSRENPVVFSSYGKGKASVNAGDGEGLLAVNTSCIKIISLNFSGSGVGKNNGSGIHFYANDSLNAPSDIEINDCEVKGFTTYGIAVGANDNIAYKGYRHVRVIHCDATANGQGGFGSYGSYMGFQHKDFYMAYCKAFGNRGILLKTENHSGNGIVMGMVDSIVIEYCEAFENGADNRCDAGGPVGIWVWMCKNAIIRHCISHDNHTGSTKDGGGFDIDGGSSNCVIQNNYSYNNDGAGYLLAEYGALFPFTNNIIRFNISANDGRKNSYGAISVWGADSAYSVLNSYVYNNTIYVDDDSLVNGTPAAVNLIGPHFKNVVIANNIFATKGNINFITSDSLRKKAAYLLHNNYYSYSSRYDFKYAAKTFSSLEQWLYANAGQEREGDKIVLSNIDPMFTNILFKEAGKEGFKLQKGSVLRKQDFVFPVYFNAGNNVTDMEGNTLQGDKKVFPGAFIK
jgi:hypothetical protein